MPLIKSKWRTPSLNADAGEGMTLICSDRRDSNFDGQHRTNKATNAIKLGYQTHLGRSLAIHGYKLQVYKINFKPKKSQSFKYHDF